MVRRDGDEVPGFRPKLIESGVKVSTKVTGEWIVFYFVEHPKEEVWWEVARLRLILAQGDTHLPEAIAHSPVFDAIVTALSDCLCRALEQIEPGRSTTVVRVRPRTEN